MQLHHRSISLHTSLLFISLAAAVIAFMGTAIRITVDNYFHEVNREEVTGKMLLMRQLLLTEGSRSSLAYLRGQMNSALSGHTDVSIQIDSPPLLFVGKSPLPAWLMRNPQPISEDSLLSWEQQGASYLGMVSVVVAPDSGRQWVVGVSIDTSEHTRFMDNFRYKLWFAGGSGLCIMAVLGLVIVRRSLRPIEAMADTVAQISVNRLQDRLSPDDFPYELRTLVHSYNAMLDRLGESMSRLASFSSDIAHEMRTPINNMMMQIQVSLSRQRDREAYLEVLYSSLEELEHLAHMISDMLFLAKAENGLAIPHRGRSINLRQEVQAVLDFYEAYASEKSIVLQVHGEAFASGDQPMLRRAINNLVSNAIRHGYPGTVINVRLEENPESSDIHVENVGEGIAPEHLERIFDRFYRVDASRTRRSESAGLGLAITRSIIQAHGGRVVAYSQQGRTRFHITLPAAVGKDGVS